MALIFRNAKGSALTYTEMDENIRLLYSASVYNATGSGGFPYTGSAIVSGSFIITGSLNVTGSITASGGYFGTASWSNQARTASYVVTAQTASYVVTSSYALTASFAANSNPGGSNTQIQYNDSGVYNGTFNATYNKSNGVFTINSASINAGLFTGSFSGSFKGNLIGSSSYASTASYVVTAQTASYFSGAVVSSSYAISASNITGEADSTMDLTNLSSNKGAGLVLPANRPPNPVNGSSYFEPPNRFWIFGGGTWKSIVVV